MQSNEKYLKWCMKQNKGIKVIKGSENLQKAYMEKAKGSIKSMEANANEGIDDWAISAGYYARYFVIYALLRRIGIKCEMHDCTIAVFRYLFASEIPSSFIQELDQAKKDRIDAQYYTGVIQTSIEDEIKNTKNFVLKIEEIINGLNKSKIQIVRTKIVSIK